VSFLKKLMENLGRYGFAIMMAGFAIAVVSLIIYMQSRYSGGIIKTLSFGFTVTGFSLYVIGRIGVVLEKRAKRRNAAGAADR